MDTIRNLKIVLKLESAAPFTQNTHYLAEKRDKHLSHYKDARAGRVLPERVTPAKRLAPEEPAPAAQEPSKFPPSRSLVCAESFMSLTAHVAATNPFAPFVPPPSSQSTPFGSNPATPQLGRSHLPIKPLPKRSAAPASRQSHGEEGTAAPAPAAVPAPGPAPSTPSPSTPAPVQPFSSSISDSDVPQSKRTRRLSSSSSSSSSSETTPPTSVGGFGEASSSTKEGAAESLPKASAEKIRAALAALAAIGLVVKEEDLGKLHPPDAYEEELELMAEVRAYFDVSYKVS